MGHRSFKRSGNSRPKSDPGSPVPMPRPEHDGDDTIAAKLIRHFKVDLSLIAQTPHAHIRKSVAQQQGIYGTEMRGPVLYIKILVEDNDVQADESVASSALKSALKSLKVVVGP